MLKREQGKRKGVWKDDRTKPRVERLPEEPVGWEDNGFGLA